MTNIIMENISFVQFGNAVTGSQHVTDGLIRYWEYTDLVDGAVSSWAASVGTNTLIQGTGTSQPNKSSVGVVTDGGDYLSSALGANLSDSGSIGLIVKIADMASQYFIFGYGMGFTDGKSITVTNPNILCNRMIDSSTGYEFNATSYPDLSSSMVYMVATYDGSGTQKMYINGTELTDTGGSSGDITIDNNIVLFDRDSRSLPAPNGTAVKYIEYYDKVLSTTEIAQNIEYYQSLGDLP